MVDHSNLKGAVMPTSSQRGQALATRVRLTYGPSPRDSRESVNGRPAAMNAVAIAHRAWAKRFAPWLLLNQ